MAAYPRQPPPSIPPPSPQWVDVSASGSGLSDSEATDMETGAPPSNMVEKILLFPTYGRMALTKAQAADAAKIGQAAAAVPGTPPSSASRATSYFGSFRSNTNSSASTPTREPSSNADEAGGSVLREHTAEGSERAVQAATSFAVPGPIEEGHDKHWLVNVKGWIYGTREQSKRRKILLSLSRRFLASSSVDAAAGTRHDERAGLFLATSMRDVKVRVAIAGLAPSENLLSLKRRASSKNLAEALENEEEIEQDECQALDWEALKTTAPGITLTTDASGFFSGTIELPADLVEQWRKTQSPTTVDHDSVRAVAFKVDDPDLHSLCSIELISPKGVTLISDVDDTIKDSSVHEGRMAAINAALFAEAKEVDGMADAYNFLRAKRVSVHYVSAGPYQLYPMLSTFLKSSKFPLGSLNLRNVWEKDHMSSRAYKHKVITRIFQDFPDRRFILVGDSGESDIETFAGLYSVAPDRIIKIFIRDVNSHKHPALPKARSFPLRSRDSPTSGTPSSPMDPLINPLVARMRGVYEALRRDAWSLFKLPEAIFTDHVISDALNRLIDRAESFHHRRDSFHHHHHQHSAITPGQEQDKHTEATTAAPPSPDIQPPTPLNETKPVTPEEDQRLFDEAAETMAYAQQIRDEKSQERPS
ncbi:hypothetical protein DFJ77DRAFT_511188 [Powellomyces hirtus]|nr:hypothetical protein DFJ77DRAFT_511188 [Powellomyces hirtus]